jgi:predicted SAM-dependent methyltransferase
MEPNMAELRAVPGEGRPRKLELGCGERPTPGYLHNDRNAFPGVDIVGNPWEIELEADSLDEVLALGVVEHLAYNDARSTFQNIHRILAPGGVFVFDVPDLPVWCGYVVDYFAGKPTPFPIQHLLATLYGWQRWSGDEHRSGWYKELVEEELVRVGYASVDYGVEHFLERGHVRNRMLRPADAHIYCVAHK